LQKAQTANLQNPQDTNPDMATYRSLVKMGMPPSEALQEIERDKALALKPAGQEHVAGVVNGKQAFANFHPETGKYTDPTTGAELTGFQPAPPQALITEGDKNLWSVPTNPSDPNSPRRVVSMRPGMDIPKGAVSLSGQSGEDAKEGGADAPTIAALKFANTYLSGGQFTGPSDEALQDQFFQMAKPSTGFRMNQAQITQLHNMQNWANSAEGIAYHASTGTWFSPQQRQQIVQTMNDLAKSKGIDVTGGQQHAVGDKVSIGGKQVTIKKLNPDGTFDY
jgi:hypothetical protein